MTVSDYYHQAADLIFKILYLYFISFPLIAQIYSATTDEKSNFTALSFF